LGSPSLPLGVSNPRACKVSSVSKLAAKLNREGWQGNLKGIETYQGFYPRLKDRESGFEISSSLFKELKSALGQITAPNHYLVFDIVDSAGNFIERKVLQSDRTAELIISQILKKGYAVLHRGIYYIPKEVWEEYKARYKEVKENPALSFEIFNLSKLIKTGDAILIDLDNVSEEEVKRFVKYLHKLGIYPEVWRSASQKGYHIYIHLIYRVVKLRETKEVNSPHGRIKQTIDEGTFYELPYANDYRIELIETAVKEVLRRLKIRYDSVSAKRAVWLEGLYNPLKGGKSEKILNGKLHRIDKVYEKLRPLWEATLKEKALLKFKRRKPKKGTYKVVSQIENETASNPIDFIQANLKNGTITSLLNQGLEPSEVGEILVSHYQGDERAFKRAWEKAQEFINATFRPLKPTRRRKERKHRHYWEYIPAIKECLEKGITTIRGISQKAKIPKTTVWEIFRRFSKEQILTQTEEVIRYLKANQKGGNKLSKEKARELGRERFAKYFEEFLKELIESKRKKGDGKKYPLGENKGIKAPIWKEIEIEGGKEGGKLDDKKRSDRSLSITPEGNGRGVVGCELSEGEVKKGKEGKIRRIKRTGVAKYKQRFIEKQPELVRFYGKERTREEVERIKPLIVGRRLKIDSWKLYEEAVWKLSERGVLVAESEETLELLKEQRPLEGRKLLKLIRLLYTKKFQKVDLREKPTIEEVLKQPSVEKLDLRGWGRYAWLVAEVLRELRLIDKTTKVEYPKMDPVRGFWEGRPLTEEYLAYLKSLEEETNQWLAWEEEIDRFMEDYGNPI